MTRGPQPFGWIVILNGAPRSGKSSIARALQDGDDWPWMNLGVDAYVREITPARYRPGLGLRPGGERPDLEPLVPLFYAALYESIAAHSRLGLNVVADLGHHDGHGRPTDILSDCARRLRGLPVLFVGVRCPVEEIMRRRNSGQPGREGEYVVGSEQTPIPDSVLAWERAVHSPGLYDLEVDTSVLSPAACATAVRQRLGSPADQPTAFRQLAEAVAQGSEGLAP